MPKFNQNSRLKDLLQDQRVRDIILEYYPEGQESQIPGFVKLMTVGTALKFSGPAREFLKMTDEEFKAAISRILTLE